MPALCYSKENHLIHWTLLSTLINIISLNMKSKFSNYACIKVEKILKCSLDSIPSHSPSVKIQILVWRVGWVEKAKHWWALKTNFWKRKICSHHPAMFCLIISSKLSRQWFKFSLNVIVKVMGSNPGYLLKSFLL